MQAFQDVCLRIQQQYAHAEQAGDAHAYALLNDVVLQGETRVREAIQKETADAIRQVIEKLRQTQPLTGDDRALLALWIVGDAQEHISMERYVGGWTAELRRIMGELAAAGAEPPTPAGASRLRVLLRDGARISDNIRRYLEYKERFTHFTEAMQALDQDARRTLVRVLEQQLASLRV